MAHIIAMIRYHLKKQNKTKHGLEVRQLVQGHKAGNVKTAPEWLCLIPEFLPLAHCCSVHLCVVCECAHTHTSARSCDLQLGLRVMPSDESLPRTKAHCHVGQKPTRTSPHCHTGQTRNSASSAVSPSVYILWLFLWALVLAQGPRSTETEQSWPKRWAQQTWTTDPGSSALKERSPLQLPISFPILWSQMMPQFRVTQS